MCDKLSASCNMKFRRAHNALTTEPWFPAPFASQFMGNLLVSCTGVLSDVARSCVCQSLICFASHRNFSIYLWIAKVDKIVTFLKLTLCMLMYEEHGSFLAVSRQKLAQQVLLEHHNLK